MLDLAAGEGASDSAGEAESVEEELDFRMRMAMEAWLLVSPHTAGPTGAILTPPHQARNYHYHYLWCYVHEVLPDIKYRNLDDPSNPARMYYVARVLPCIDGQYGEKVIVSQCRSFGLDETDGLMVDLRVK
jgi:hypothetical protein